MRSTTSFIDTALAKKLGNDPQLVIQLDWGVRPEHAYAGLGGVRYYGFKDSSVLITGTPVNVEGRLLSVSDITSSKKAENVGSIGTANIELQDDDGNLKATLDRLPLERRSVSIWQCFQGVSDTLLLFSGKVIGPIEWSEGKRTLSLSFETIVQDNEVGFYPETKDSVPGVVLNLDVVGKPWPLAFGNVIHVPAVRVTKPPRANLNRVFQSPDDKFEVLDGSVFPQNTYIKVNIDGVIFSGKFNQGTTYPDPDAPGGVIDGVNLFQVFEANLPKYQNVLFGPRRALDPGDDPNTVAWLRSYVPIVNNYCLMNIGHTEEYFRCVRQEGLKVWFAGISSDGPVSDGFTGIISEIPGTPHLLNEDDQILQVAKHGRVGWTIQEMSSVTGLQTADMISRVPWKFLSNTEVVYWSGQPDTYVANIIPGTIVSVYAYRTLKNEGRLFTHIPSIYYTKQENHAINVIDQFGATKTLNTTALQFFTAIENFEGQGWEEQIYVTMRSSVGPNSSDVIKWLLQAYSNLTVDATTFNAVQTLVDKYPVGFAYLDTRNVMRAVDEIAWQSRCALIIDQGKVFIKYISKKPAKDLDVVDANTAQKTLELTFSETSQIITKFKASWKDTYQGLATNTKYIYKHTNQDKYGLYARTYDLYIYNIESLVQKTVNFWANRLGNSWRLAKVKNFAPAIPLQLYDCVQFIYTDVTLMNPPILGGLLGILQKYKYAPKKVPTIDVEFELPAIAGGTADIYNYWLDDSTDVKPADPTRNYREIATDILLADDESRARQSNAKQPTPSIVTSITSPATGFDGVVDLYADGYGNPATATNQPTAWVDPANPPIVGTKMTTYDSGKQNFSQQIGTSTSGNVIGTARITSRTSGSTYAANKTNYPGGPDTIPTAAISVTEMSGSTVIAAGTHIFYWMASNGFATVPYFWFPAGDCN